jgi:hypothetical protein
MTHMAHVTFLHMPASDANYDAVDMYIYAYAYIYIYIFVYVAPDANYEALVVGPHHHQCKVKYTRRKVPLV